jgi:drug/metabolite transporter (DMT)-like permease
MNPTLLGLLTCLIWSSSSLLVTLAGRIPAFEILALSWGVAFIILYFRYALKGRPAINFRAGTPADYLLVLCGFCGSLICYYFAFKLAPPFEANALNYLWPLFLIGFISLLEKRRPSLLQIGGMVLGFAGCLALLAARAEDFYSGRFGLGHVLAIMGALFWANYSARSRHKTYGAELMVPVFLISTLVYASGQMAAGPWVWPNAMEWTAIFLLGINDAAFALWDHAMRKGDAILLTSVAYFIPLFSTILLIAGGFSAAGPLIFLAAGLIIAGCIIVNLRQIQKLAQRLKK